TVSSLAVAGTREEVAEHLRRATAALQALADGRPTGVDLEAVRTRLLAEEAAGALDGPLLPAAVARFGARGHGAAAFALLGLPGLSEEELSAWVRSHVTTGGCVLHGEGLSVDDVVLTVPEGPGAPEPEPRQTPGVRRARLLRPPPSPDEPVALTLSALVPRTWASQVALWTLLSAVERRLGPRAASVVPVSLPLSSTQALVSIEVATLPGEGEACTHLLVAAFEEVVGRGPTAEQFAADLRTLLRRTPTLGPHDVRRQVALEMLHGAASEESGEPRQGLADVSWSAVGQVLAGLPATAVLESPADPADDRWTPVRLPDPAPLDAPHGTVFASLGARSQGARLEVGPERLGTAASARDPGRVVRWDDVEVVLRGRQQTQVVQRDGGRLFFTPAHWVDRRGGGVEAALEQAAPPGVVRPLAAFRDRVPPPVRTRLPPRARLRLALSVVGAVVLLPTGLLALLAALAGTDPGGNGTLAVLALLLAAGCAYDVVRTRRRAREGTSLDERSVLAARLDAWVSDQPTTRLPRLVALAWLLLPVAFAAPVLLGVLAAPLLLLVLPAVLLTLAAALRLTTELQRRRRLSGSG
ncbi:MAG: putative Zn-dependent peptidase, partial [Frankiales bacterium]|nr:putative Zn-dependent peptidase [Frankiales bacterium]